MVLDKAKRVVIGSPNQEAWASGMLETQMMLSDSSPTTFKMPFFLYIRLALTYCNDVCPSGTRRRGLDDL